MLCEKCHKKQATIYMERIINGQQTVTHLCQECAQIYNPLAQGLLMPGLLHVLIGGAPVGISPQRSSSVEKCPVCGLAYEDFVKTKTLGCANCYQAFREDIDEMLKVIHNSNHHEGKYPQKSAASLLNKRKVEKLKIELTKAIKSEEYEEAAKLRDQIRALEGSK